jgi:hypothetical protein
MKKLLKVADYRKTGWALPTPGNLLIEEFQASEEVMKHLKLNISQFKAKDGLYACTYLEVLQDGYESKSGKTYPKGTVWIVPTR